VPGSPSVFFGISPVSARDAEGPEDEREPSLPAEVSEFLEYQLLD